MPALPPVTIATLPATRSPRRDRGWQREGHRRRSRSWGGRDSRIRQPTREVPAVPDAPTTTIEQIDGLRTAVLREPASGSEAHVVLDVGANVHRFRTRVGD